MAYATKYRFQLDSLVSGHSFRIDIQADGYAGAPIVRPLGRAPLLKRERSGAVCGSSLEIYAECNVDGEFLELYTSSATEFKVLLYSGSTCIWQGFVSPELYSEPDIAPPYDVQIIATDGLGELKMQDFEPQGENTLLSLIEGILRVTGLSLPVVTNNRLTHQYCTGVSMLRDTRVDIDSMMGESCYDVLTKLLDTLGMTVLQHNRRWVLLRVNDLNRSGDGVALYSATNGTAQDFVRYEDCGNVGSGKWWPVGQLESVVEPALNKKELTAKFAYRDSVLVNPDFDYDGGWATEGTVSYDPDERAYIISDESAGQAGGYISQRLTLSHGYSTVLTLRGYFGETDKADRAKVFIDGEVDGHAYRLLMGRDDNYYWAYDNYDSEDYISAELPYNGSEEDHGTGWDLVIPVNDFGDFTAITVRIGAWSEEGNQLHLLSARLVKYEQAPGSRRIVYVNNGSRGEDSPIELLFGQLVPDHDYTGLQGFAYGVPVAGGDIVTSWSSGAMQDSASLLELRAVECAGVISLPRLRKKGVLNVEDATGMPMLFESAGELYIAETWSWDILNDELDVNMITLPNAQTASSSQVVESAKTDGPVGGGIIQGAQGGSGTRDYNALTSKPAIDGTRLQGDMASYDDLGLMGRSLFAVEGTGDTRAIHFLLPIWADAVASGGQVAPGSGGGGGSSVRWQQLVLTGTHIANIVIGNQVTPVYAPTSGSEQTTDVAWGASGTNYETLVVGVDARLLSRYGHDHVADEIVDLEEYLDGYDFATRGEIISSLSEMTDDSGHRTVTDAQIALWTGKPTLADVQMWVMAQRYLQEDDVLNMGVMTQPDVEDLLRLYNFQTASEVRHIVEGYGYVTASDLDKALDDALKDVLKDVVTLSTAQTITGQKTFTRPLLPGAQNLTLGDRANPWGTAYLNAIVLKNGSNSVTLELDADGNLKINGNAYATGSLASGGSI